MHCIMIFNANANANANANRPWSIGANVRGYMGEREGVMGRLMRMTGSDFLFVRVCPVQESRLNKGGFLVSRFDCLYGLFTLKGFFMDISVILLLCNIRNV